MRRHTPLIRTGFLRIGKLTNGKVTANLTFPLDVGGRPISMRTFAFMRCGDLQAG